jgi:hypothetical protein
MNHQLYYFLTSIFLIALLLGFGISLYMLLPRDPDSEDFLNQNNNLTSKQNKQGKQKIK